MFILNFALTDLNTNNISRDKQTNVSEDAWNTVESFGCYVISDIETIIIYQKLGLFAHNKVLKYIVFNVCFLQRRQIR